MKMNEEQSKEIMECIACYRDKYRKDNPKAMMTMVAYPHTCDKGTPLCESLGVKFVHQGPQIWNENWIVNLNKK